MHERARFLDETPVDEHVVRIETYVVAGNPVDEFRDALRAGASADIK
jgi:hypothetical protein